ncbi:MAG: hypothetical protein O7G85_14000 [Planctomycetota bacterium]|nr:hypothetical protein [Planctomycetota bacterium]
MRDLDEKIRMALLEKDRELFDEHAGEQGLFEMVAETFRGRHRWLVILVCFYSVVFTGLAIFTAVRFFQADESSMREMIAWAIAFVFCFNAVAMLKMWYFMEMNKNSTIREIKRVELQIARLAGRLETSENPEKHP